MRILESREILLWKFHAGGSTTLHCTVDVLHMYVMYIDGQVPAQKLDGKSLTNKLLSLAPRLSSHMFAVSCSSPIFTASAQGILTYVPMEDAIKALQ